MVTGLNMGIAYTIDQMCINFAGIESCSAHCWQAMMGMSIPTVAVVLLHCNTLSYPNIRICSTKNQAMFDAG